MKFKILLVFLTMFATKIFAMSEYNNKIFDFEFEDIDGNQVSLEKFQGKPIILINTASRCGFTPQYGNLQKLFENYRESDLVFVATPSNDFKQELSSEEEIKKYCLINYGVSFRVTEIIKLKGNDAHPLFKWIKEDYNQEPKWNFYKYLFNRDGQLVESWSSMTKPTNSKILKSINKIL